MKLLVVNADDFGYTSGVNQGILQAHTQGIVTSTSLMLRGLALEEAAEIAKSLPDLDVGLHFQLSDEGLPSMFGAYTKVYFSSNERALYELERHVERFEKLIGKMPTHIDSHHHIHLHTKLRPIFEEFSAKHNIPARGLGGNKLLTSFYGQNHFRWGGAENIRPSSLRNIIENLEDGVNEIMCHPGVADADLVQSTKYAKEREIELATLTSPEVKLLLEDYGIQLANWTQAWQIITTMRGA